jgi:transposase
VLPGLRGTLVHDSLSLHNRYADAGHQLCGAHVVRDPTAAEQGHPGGKRPQQARRVRADEIPEISATRGRSA